MTVLRSFAPFRPAQNPASLSYILTNRTGRKLKAEWRSTKTKFWIAGTGVVLSAVVVILTGLELLMAEVISFGSRVLFTMNLSGLLLVAACKYFLVYKYAS